MENKMKTALIMGINGGFGGYAAKALKEQGWKIKALMRDPKKRTADLQDIDVIKGDASNIADVRQASQNVDLVVYGINPANYDWEEKALNWLNITATVAEEKNLNIIFPGNVYVFNPKNGTDFNESVVFDPITTKGKIRQEMEQRLQLASNNGAKVIILRCGDFIGNNADSTWIKLLIKSSKKGYTLTSTGTRNLQHSWAYLPDVAKVVTNLSDKFEQLDNFNIFHFKGHRFSFDDIAEFLKQQTGQKIKMKKFPWFIIRFITPFSTLMAGVFEMRYLWKSEINLNDAKLNKVLGYNYIPTPLREVMLESEIIK